MPLLGSEFADILHACALGRLDKAPKLSIAKGCSACVVAAASGYPEAARSGDLIQINLESNSSLQIFHAGTKRTAKNEILTSGGRVLSVVAQGESFDVAFNNVYQGLKKIHFNGITIRKDIGHQVRKF